VTHNFRQWLVSQKDRNDAIGDLAGDVFSDIQRGCMPVDCKSFVDIAEHVYGHSHCTGCEQALRKARHLYTGRSDLNAP
jgi:uncharacterized protein YozE (UPF0346 family)